MPIKPRQIFAVLLLGAATLGALASEFILADQLRLQRSVAPVVIGSAAVAQTNALFEIAQNLPLEGRTALLSSHGFDSLNGLESALSDQRIQLANAERTRSTDVQRMDKGVLELMALALFAFFATAGGAISLFDAYRRAEALEVASVACPASLVRQ